LFASWDTRNVALSGRPPVRRPRPGRTTTRFSARGGSRAHWADVR
jgi:hypothetical protein